jgi:hypothetical protein
VPGVRNIKNREGLKWEEFSQGQTDVPPTVSKELSNLMADFQNNFNAFSGGDKHVRMIWAYVTKDAAIQQAHINAIEESDDPKKDQFKELINWMDKYGARLWMSPSAIDRHIQSTGQKVKHSSNTSMKWLEQFGYIWGLGKKGDYRDRRDAHDLSDEHVEKLKNDPASREQFDASGQELMKVVTAQKNGAYGIFFTPDDGFNLTPVIGTDYYKASNTDENNSEWVNWDHFRSESGQHSKYFGISQKQPNGDVKKMFVYPTSTQFFLPNGEQDPNPQVVSKAELKSSLADKTEYVWNNNGTQVAIPNDQISKSDKKLTYVWNKPDRQRVEIPARELQIKAQPLYYLWIKNDGTLWWVPKDMRNEVAGKERKSVKKREAA